MIQHHLESCDSTSTVLRSLLEDSASSSILVSTDLQVSGQGRLGKSWIGLENAIAMSFVIEANPTTPTLTSLEVGLAVSEYLESHHQAELQLKWPNDLLGKSNQKVGGILLQNLKSNLYLCGIGINWSDPEHKLAALDRLPGQYPAGALFENRPLSSDDKKRIPFELATYINKRLPEIRLECFSTLWTNMCAHKDKLVEIVDNDKKVSGFFKGIGPYGEAILKTEQEEILKIYSGSLFIL